LIDNKNSQDTTYNMGVIQGGPEKIQLETIDSFVVNSNFCEPCEPPCRFDRIDNIVVHFKETFFLQEKKSIQF